MALPHNSITPIPNNEPDAVPALWNTRYEEIDENFASLDGRVVSRENEINQARGGKASLDDRLDEMASDIGATSVDMQNATVAALKFAIDQAALANYGVRALREQIQQEGVVTILNRGVVSGCVASKSGTAARNLNLSAGICFANGRAYSLTDSANAASVPSNTGAGSVTVYAYLYQDAGGLWRLAVTPTGSDLPNGSIRIYNVTIPANSTDATDPNLTNVTLTDVRRIEAQFPQLLNSPASTSIVLQTLSESDYKLDFDVVSAVGAPCESKGIVVSSRATNGFTVLLASAADNVVVRWKASKLNN
jgi:hypothetical protein